MEEWQKKPLDFGEILDLTFRLIKGRFSRLFMLMLILMGPVYLLDIIGSLVGGTALFREPLKNSAVANLNSGSKQLDQILGRIQGMENTPLLSGDHLVTGLIVAGLVGLATLILGPVAHAAVLLLVDDVRNKRSNPTAFTIKSAFSRYWALLGSSIIYFLIVMASFAILSGIVTGIGFLLLRPLSFPTGIGITLIVILSISAILFAVFLAIRLSFYFAAVVFEKVAPGVSKSWRLTKTNFWRLLGLFIVLFMITSIITGIINSVFGMLLGQSALSTLIKDLLSMVTNLVLYVGYAVVYFDLRVRNEGEDLVDMIASFQSNPNDVPVNNEKTEQDSQTNDSIPPVD